MSQKSGAFVAKLQVPSGTVIDYRLLLTKTTDGPEGKTLESVGDFRRIATTDGIINVTKKEVTTDDAIRSEPSVNTSETSGRTSPEYRNRNVYWLILAFLALNVAVIVLWRFRKTM